MSKETLRRRHARQFIFLQNYIPFLVIVIILYFLGVTGLALLGLLIGKVIVAFLLTFYRIRNGGDGKLVKKWHDEAVGKYHHAKEKLKERRDQLRNEYQIKAIVTNGDRDRSFFVRIDQKIIPKLLPILTVNTVEVPFELYDERTLLCFAAKVITAKEKEISFGLGAYKFVFKNPYYMNADTPKVSASWQCEGHTDERKIFLSKEFFPFINPNVLYEFTLLIGGRSLGIVTGNFIADANAIVIPISGINKKDCRGKECVLRPSVDIGHNIILPPPTVLSVNHVAVEKIHV